MSHWRVYLNQQLKPPQLIRPPLAIGIIVVCVAVFLANNISAHLALWPTYSGYFQPWQLISYAFLHGGFNHLFFNMFAVWMFGTPLERSWGTRRYLSFFAVCVAGAAVAQLGVQLFDRARREIRLTPEGNRLIRYGNLLLSEWRKARQDVTAGGALRQLFCIDPAGSGVELNCLQ